ncbi:MAG TPA: M48 family metallopeptidase [Phycisphaerales bacterium]|nr:M48 family metallopeptidase [Phycisphaerales bacterium]HMP36231.1 M48 family metallopeptidase [Phycisphaerales bacterium]
MAIDFFERQEAARRSTTRLVVLFALALLCIVALVYLAVAAFVAAMGADLEGGAPRLLRFDPLLLLIVTLGVGLVVGLGSAWKTAMLRGGGRAVAEMLGGRLIDPGTRDPDERRLLNVVEEMAVASGTPVPPTYVMDGERAINAFAAGWSPEDAVIGMTRGSLELLDRDELQGVVAHEFSHILNGDMRLNIRLIGLLHGILIIGLAGMAIMRSMLYAGHGAARSRSRRGGDGGAAILAILALGAALMIIGFVGLFFGRLIKAAVSRQREYLADASAVQFTRNPEGIGKALVKIGASSGRARLAGANVGEASHMFFGDAVAGTSWFGALSTHPPLEERIRRVVPGWDGAFPKLIRRPSARDGTERPRERRGGADSLGDALRRTGFPGAIPGAAAGAALAAGAHPGSATAAAPDFDAAARILASIDPAVSDAAHEPYGARAVILCLLLSARPSLRAEQQRVLAGSGEPELATLVRKLDGPIAAADPRSRLATLEICMPALRSLARGQYETFRSRAEALVAMEQPPSIFGWVLRRLVIQHLDRHFGLAAVPRPHHYAIARLRSELATLLSFLAHAGNRTPESVQGAFRAGARAAGEDLGDALPAHAIDSPRLDAALDRLAELAPRLKRRVLEACAATIAVDAVGTATEIEILRAVADTLDVPAPPWQPGERLA